MESTKYYLNILQKRNRYQIFIQHFLGVAYSLYGFFKHFYYNNNLWESLIWIFGGFTIIFIAYLNHKVFSAYFIEFTDTALSLKLSIRKKKEILWKDISDIEIKSTRIILKINNEPDEAINLSNTNYQNVISIKKASLILH